MDAARETAVAASRPGLGSRLRDERGASIIIALLFFLICAIIGSVVLTAASVGAKAVQTHKELQQAEYAVGSAAQMVGAELASTKIAMNEREGDRPFVIDANSGEFAKTFWDENDAAIVKARKDKKDFALPITVGEGNGIGALPVYGTITVDPDLNVTVALSLAKHDASDAEKASSPYNMTVYVQCIPTYDAGGKLKAFEFEDAVVQKAGGTS